MSLKHILDGCTVLDFTQFLSGPTTSRMMAEMGAEVIKVELAPAGDPSRLLPYLKDGRSGYYVQQNRGKKSLCVNLRDPRGLALVKALLPKVDVLVENFSPGVIGRLGLDWETVHAINPELIMCSISAFGQTGPLSRLSGFDYIAQAYAGIISMIGEPAGTPYIVGAGIGDVSTGMAALAAINGALYWRRGPGGTGQYLDISLLDTLFHCHEVNVQLYSGSRGEVKPLRSGAHHGSAAPLGVFKGKERYMIILALGQQWPKLCAAIGQPELADDPRFADNDRRIANREALADIISEWLAAQPSDDEALRRLHEAHVPAAPVLSVAEAIAHPHLIERRTVRTIEDRGLGTLDVPGMPLRFSAFPGELPLDAPFLGEHNREILTGRLGCSADEVASLEAAGVLGSEPIPAPRPAA